MTVTQSLTLLDLFQQLRAAELDECSASQIGEHGQEALLRHTSELHLEFVARLSAADETLTEVPGEHIIPQR